MIKSKENLKTKGKLAAIRKVKADLDKIQVTELASFLKMSRSNIYYHLDENRAANVSIPHLKNIADGIKKLIQKKESEERKALSQI